MNAGDYVHIHPANNGSQPKLGSNNQLKQPYIFLFSIFTVSRLVNPLEEEEEVLEEDEVMPRRILSKYRTSEVDVADRCCQIRVDVGYNIQKTSPILKKRCSRRYLCATVVIHIYSPDCDRLIIVFKSDT